MKKSNKILVVVAIVFALIVGFLIGISVDYPRINLGEVSGTIGKVNNYRNTKATETDIQLKDELQTDSVLLKSIKNYMSFFYVRSLELGKNIDFAVTESNANEAFKTKCGSEIAALESYGKFLGTTRKDLLLVVATCQSIEKADPVLLRNSISQANNIVAQMSYRNNVVLNFITGLDAFIQEKGIESNPGLNKAHDLLTYNEVSTSLILKDKVLLKFFDKKRLYSKDLKSSDPTNYKENVERDMESLGFFDTEKLAGIEFTDVEKLGTIICDVEKLGASFSDTEKLGGGFTDTEKLGAVEMDTEKLGTGFTDSEKLGVVNDAEKLGGFWDQEKLGAYMLDAEKLGSWQ